MAAGTYDVTASAWATTGTAEGHYTVHIRYCLAEKSDFATNNIAIAEKQIWRNNFVLEIVGHSCNLHTNAANEALDATYMDKLAATRAHYDAIPEPHLGMVGSELDEWRARLAATIHAYTNGISPFAAQ